MRERVERLRDSAGQPWEGMTEVTEWAVRIDGKDRPLGFGAGEEAKRKAERFITDNEGHKLELVSRKAIITEWTVSE